jgi:hypothetical protein
MMASGLRSALEAMPTKASKLIDALVQENVAETREKLTFELVSDLRLYADLEEQHLFPMLSKIPEAETLLPSAVDDNNKLRERLAALESQRKDTEDYLQQIAALKRDLETHLRRERDLLPGLIKALDEDEAQRIAGKIDGAIREAEAAKREHDATRRDARWREARHTQDSAERTAQTIALSAAETLEASRRLFVEWVEQMQQVGSSIADAVTIHREITVTTAEDVRPGALVAFTAAGAVAELGSVWTNWFNRSVENSLRATQRIGQSRTLKEAAEAQRDFVHAAVVAALDRDIRLLEVALRTSAQALAPLRERVTVRS